ncbi:MAG: CPBP family intramembrane metalloprotease [Oscillospiraceae bacterium]|nr:CPBP family intramembrane metalloprotease [Oscillospiraceae bacterium]
MAEQNKKLDVIADFSYSSENEAYNQAYRQWRRTNKAPYMYRYSGNPNEVTYVDGNAVSMPDAPQTESKALMHCATLLGMALLTGMLLELAGGASIVGIMRLLGIRIRLDFLSLSMRGSQWAVAAARALTCILKYAVPAALLMRLGRLPRHVSVPVGIGGLPETIAAVGAAMCIAGVYSLTAQEAGVLTAQEIFDGNNREAVLSYGLFDALFVSLLAELLLRGTMLPLLRQFGDSFAVAMTATAAFLMPNMLPDRIAELLIGLCSGYLLLRSGSFAKCVLLRTVCTVLCHARIILVYANGTIPLWQYAMLLLTSGTLLAVFYVHIRKEHIRLGNRDTQLSEGRKFFIISQSVTVLPWAGVSVLLMLFQLFF